MRLIDAEPIIEMLKLVRKSADSPRRDLDLLNLQQILELAPTIVPSPNDPLTLDELREMDGEPVWVTKNGQGVGYALVYSPCSIVYITCAAGSKWDVEDLLDEGCKIYRRKPEEVTHHDFP